tara:strand:- start:1109 stop:1489 length:381 start_codon:yes stop_codon:yes gene_type:complete
MGINSQEVAYGFGQMGSVFTDTANAPITPPSDKVFVAITFLADTQLEILGTNAGGLTGDTSDPNAEYIGTDVAAHDAGSATTVTGTGGKIIDNSNTFPKGVTIYGRFTSVEIGAGKTGALIAYIGN